MTEEFETEIVIGLSDEEKDDLEKMIKAFRKEQLDGAPVSAVKGELQQIDLTKANLARFGDMLLKFDAKIKSFYEIICLCCKKDEILNQRIDAIIEIIKGQDNL
ncbi:MAG: hypothetical protein ACE5DO_06670 [Desulfobacterales bacterium]